MNGSRDMLAANSRRPDQEHRAARGGRQFDLSADASHSRAIARQAIKVVRLRRLLSEAADRFVQLYRFILGRRPCQRRLVIASKRRWIEENQDADRLVIAAKRDEFSMAGIGLGIVVRIGDSCCYSSAMKDLGRRANCVGGALGSVAASRLVASDPANDVRGRYAEPLGAGFVDKSDPPLIIQCCNRLCERIEEPRQILG